jgi:NADH:ubiquinone oxidoreductase subunit 4 (subunit M)
VIILVPILVLILWIGLYPNYFFGLINPTVERLTAALQAAAVAMH